MAKTFYKGAQAVVLVFDLTSIESFKEINDLWFKETRKSCDKDVIIILVGNKKDLIKERVVT